VPGTLPAAARHLLMVLPAGDDWCAATGSDLAAATLARRGKQAADLATTVVAVQLSGGALASWVRVDPAAPAFERHTALRKALAPLLAENPTRLDVVLWGDEQWRRSVAPDAAYVAAVNAPAMPSRKRSEGPVNVEQVVVHGAPDAGAVAAAGHVAAGNVLCRQLTVEPANVVTPAAYRAELRELAAANGWSLREWNRARLERMGAGAFTAVARGSDHGDAAVVRLTYDGRPRGRGPAAALVGKGLCFDTGGHTLKTGTSMFDMHHDMNGSAVAVGALLAATRLKLPVRIDAWLAIAQNHLSPTAYTPNEVVTALNGTTIEVTDTDAEGRMVLADTLTMAAREQPDLIVDFATLTGAMWTAVGSRMSGVLSNRDEWAQRAVSLGAAVGERLVAFPLPADYDESLESKVADVKQCDHTTGKADHILAGRFLGRFVDDRPWVHVDLSSVTHPGGLGAVAHDVNGTGVAWAVALLRHLVDEQGGR
jgi:leucyl aminopeptidase